MEFQTKHKLTIYYLNLKKKIQTQKYTKPLKRHP